MDDEQDEDELLAAAFDQGDETTGANPRRLPVASATARFGRYLENGEAADALLSAEFDDDSNTSQAPVVTAAARQASHNPYSAADAHYPLPTEIGSKIENYQPLNLTNPTCSDSQPRYYPVLPDANAQHVRGNSCKRELENFRSIAYPDLNQVPPARAFLEARTGGLSQTFGSPTSQQEVKNRTTLLVRGGRPEDCVRHNTSSADVSLHTARSGSKRDELVDVDDMKGKVDSWNASSREDYDGDGEMAYEGTRANETYDRFTSDVEAVGQRQSIDSCRKLDELVQNRIEAERPYLDEIQKRIDAVDAALLGNTPYQQQRRQERELASQDRRRRRLEHRIERAENQLQQHMRARQKSMMDSYPETN